MSDLREIQSRNDAECFDSPRLQHRIISYINIQVRDMHCEIFMRACTTMCFSGYNYSVLRLVHVVTKRLLSESIDLERRNILKLFIKIRIVVIKERSGITNIFITTMKKIALINTTITCLQFPIIQSGAKKITP